MPRVLSRKFRLLIWMSVSGLLAVFLWGGGLSAVRGQVPQPAARPAASPEATSSPGTSERRTSSKSVIGALRDQILGSPVLEEAGAADSLLESLDEADSLFQDAKRHNRDALRRLNQRPRHGQAAGPHPQNIVVVVFERLGPQRLDADEIGAAMPNLRRLAAQGATFAQAYAGSADVDTSYWTLLTGKNTGRLAAGVNTTNDLGLDPALPELLERAGYVTAGVGHWPMRPEPTDAGFDFWSGISGTEVRAELHPREMSLGAARMQVPGNRENLRGSTLWQLVEAELTSWLSARPSSAEPFCLVARLPIPDRDSVAGAVGLETLQAWDHVLETLGDTLERNGLSERTCIIATALVSEAEAAGPLSGSRLSEQHLRIPLVVAGSFRKTGEAKIDRPVALWDVLPSCLALAASNRSPADRDGVPYVARGGNAVSPTDRVLYWRSPDQARDQAVRKGRWKAIYSAKDQRVLLFDLENDPNEHENVAVEHAEIVKELLFGAPEAVNAALKKLQR